jgi:arsenite-transporting ATPase
MKNIGIDTEESEAGSNFSFIKEIMASVPGIDEATSFGEVLKSLDNYNFDLILFDTAPTGHTLRLLNFPNILEKALAKLIQLKEKFGGMISQFSGMMGGTGEPGEDPTKKIFDAMDSMKRKIEDINNQF